MQVLGGFLTEEYAQRTWYAKLFSYVSFGGYNYNTKNGNILVRDRESGKLEEEKMPMYIRLGIRLLYQGVAAEGSAFS